jgi:hypothetical protein
LRYPLSKERHEGGIKCSLAENPTKHIRKAKSCIESIGDHAGANQCPDEDIAQKSQYPAHQSEPGKGHQSAQHLGKSALAEPEAQEILAIPGLPEPPAAPFGFPLVLPVTNREDFYLHLSQALIFKA